MKIASDELPWVTFVKNGKLESAFKDFSPRDKRIFKWFALLASPFIPWTLYSLRKILENSKLDKGEISIDLSLPFLFFYKSVNRTGPVLFYSIVTFYFKKRHIPVRAVAWLTHWCVFRGQYTESIKVYKFLLNSLPENNRISGEVASFMGFYYYVTGDYEASSQYHLLADKIFKSHNDTFFEMFNLGQWIRLSLFNDNLEYANDIFSKFDKLNPEVPDDRYGLRILSYTTLINFYKNRDDLAGKFYSSAKKVFTTSSSHLDKAIFKIIESLIFFHTGSSRSAILSINESQEELAQYGRYIYYEHLVEFLRVYYLTGIKSKKIVKKYPKFIKIFNSKDDLFLKNKKEDISRINTFLWQEKYFEDVIELFESLNSGNLELFLDKITKITSATKITHMINEISDNAPLIFLIDDDKISSVFRFEIMLDTQRALFNISTPFSNWRNPEIVTALKSIITILQISSEKSFLKQQSYKLDKLIYFNEKARQVAHDIRSPLAALDVVLHEDTVTFEQKRVIIRTATNRIHEIANDLLFQNRLSEAHLENKNLHQRVMLLDIVNNVLVEKRFEFRNRGQSLFSTIFPSRTYGIFGLVCAGELKRVLSNLLNNAIDATDIVSGEIVVSLELRDNKSVIGIRDNGKGISSESLTKLGKQGFTFGKGSGGSGLGFFHAKKTIVSFGGEIKVESKVGVGTTVSIYLPLAEPPKTFVNNITVKKGDIVAIVDDDQSIHQVWESKLAGVKMEHFNSTLNVKSNADFYLVDYEFLGEEKSGLDFIEENNLASKAILVTSRYEDPEIQERCERQNIKLLSKGLVPYVSVVIEKDFDTILIDDDELVRMVWDSKAKEKGVEFKSYADPSEANFEGLNKEACIYIDSNLANGLKGEELALKLFNDGFKNIYMATGYNPEDFKDLTFLKGVIGKSPPWA